ncbi:MAG: sigma-54-dependent Fis family transcriptional regulator [Rhodobacteraceae bacterium]|nr:MAG: sigma-54-dependent Fis family transcriptional regulator [Paracoccaceae bacterium]
MPLKAGMQDSGDPFAIEARRLDRAWERYHADARAGRPKRCAVDPEVRSLIGESWLRSTTAGVDPCRAEAPCASEAEAVQRLRRANSALLDAAHSAVARIGRMLAGADAMLILTDDEGVILEAIGDPDTIARARRINLFVGGVWNEHAVGTNGIGTALWAGEPAFVHGREHYVEGLREWSCAAAPIRDPLDGRVLGAIDLSGLTKIFRRHNIAFAAAAAGEIEAALARMTQEERMRLLEALAQQAPAAMRDSGALILDRQGRVIHSIGQPRLCGADGVAAAPRIGQRLARLEGDFSPEALTKALPPRLNCRGVEPLVVNGEVRGLAVMLGRPEERRGRPAASAARQGRGPTIVGDCTGVRDAIALARRVARVNAPVLVQGETGVGKELFARLIHAEIANGPDTPFVAINCGAVSKELVGAELFGHVEGAFTGALKDGRPGKLELANGGVFCLDEVGEMPLDIQPYLLRVLEERVIHRVGDTRGRPFDARLVALTNRDLRAEAEAGRFRSDLFYRISAVTIHVPPLRERGDDVQLLLDHFNHAIAAEYGVDPLSISDAARALFSAHDWPGNVRELRNLMQRLHSLSLDRRVDVGDLPVEMRAPVRASDARVERGSLREAEKQAVLRALDEHRGNLSRVAEALGISRPTLYRKLRDFEIHRVFR